MSTKGCPFCGSTRNIIMKAIRNGVKKGENVETRWVQCCDCGARGSERGTKQKAVDAWETRKDTWTPVLLGTPEQMSEDYPFSDAVLVATSNRIEIGCYKPSDEKWYLDDDEESPIEINFVKCWMPLPVPPAEKLRW